MRHIPVVLLSTSESSNFIEQAYQFGANAYIVKPCTLDGYQRIAHAVSLCFLNNYSIGTNSGSLRGAAGKRIVVIEDNPDQAELMEMFIKKDAPGLNIIHHTSAEDAILFFESLDKAASAEIDLIIVDLYLPARKQGLDLLSWLSMSFVNKGIPFAPVVVLSASKHQHDIEASFKLQANAYLVKTAEPTKCFSYLSDLCAVWWDTISFPKTPENGIA